jgi:carbon starvation protein
MNSLWLILTALAAFLVAYRYYGAFLAAKVAVINDKNATPAHRLRDGVDYHPTKGLVLFGHHFAAIAGSGPLIGPVLASQWGYFPGFAWIVVGSCLAGGVHDFIILVASVRHDGKTLSKIARELIGPLAGITTAIATLFIIIASLASTAIVVVNALSESAWAFFTIVVTIPAALLTGLWMYKIRPGRIGEASVIGVTIVFIGVIAGKPFADSAFGHYLMFSKPTLSIMLPAYAAIASILPVWVLMCPRDYLSSYMKIGVIAVLAAGMIIIHPELKMPATTHFIHGGGPVVSGPIWPFVCIVIMCGAISGFHSLIASGTTPKMINKESDMLPIGYGAMILEGFVALMALLAACALEPGDYFKINVAQDSAIEQGRYEQLVTEAKVAHNWDLIPRELKTLEERVDEKLTGRVGGAVTLAVGMAKVFSSLPGMRHLMAYWYHFVIMFEALFILTLLETGTRVARFVFQETLAHFHTAAGEAHKARWSLNIFMSVFVCFLWGFLLYTGNLNALWRMLGLANQLLAAISLTVGTSYLLRYAPKRKYALCTFIPLVLVVVTVFFASIESIQSWWHELGTPGLAAMQLFTTKLLCGLASIMLVLTVVIVLDALRSWKGILWPRDATPNSAA